MTILKEMIVRYETDGHTVKGFDAGELIRCKDCEVASRCLMYWSNNDPNGFCKWAERKENGNQG